MGYNEDRARATRNINKGNGFMCPTCESYIPQGYDVCPRCGDQPATSYLEDDGCITGIVRFVLITGTPLVYYLTSIEFVGFVLMYFLIIPYIIIIFMGILNIKIAISDRKKLARVIEERDADMDKAIHLGKGPALIALRALTEAKSKRKQTLRDIIRNIWVLGFVMLAIINVVNYVK